MHSNFARTVHRSFEIRVKSFRKYMNFCLYPFVIFTPDRWNVRVVRRNVRNIRSLFVSRSLFFLFERKIVNVCFPVDGHIMYIYYKARKHAVENIPIFLASSRWESYPIGQKLLCRAPTVAYLSIPKSPFEKFVRFPPVQGKLTEMSINLINLTVFCVKL